MYFSLLSFQIGGGKRNNHEMRYFIIVYCIIIKILFKEMKESLEQGLCGPTYYLAINTKYIRSILSYRSC